MMKNKTTIILVAALIALCCAGCLRPLFGAEGTAPIIDDTQATAAAAVVVTQSIWITLLNTPAVSTLIASLVVAVLKMLHDRNALDTDRWSALVLNLYNMAEKEGIVQKWSGYQKLDCAMNAFERQFRETFGYAPTDQDAADMRNDLAKVAYDDDTTVRLRELAAPKGAMLVNT